MTRSCSLGLIQICFQQVNSWSTQSRFVQRLSSHWIAGNINNKLWIIQQILHAIHRPWCIGRVLHWTIRVWSTLPPPPPPNLSSVEFFDFSILCIFYQLSILLKFFTMFFGHQYSSDSKPFSCLYQLDSIFLFKITKSSLIPSNSAATSLHGHLQWESIHFEIFKFTIDSLLSYNRQNDITTISKSNRFWF